MNLKKKSIIGIILAFAIVISGTFISWFFFFREEPNGATKDPDLTVTNYSVENDNLMINISNIGEANAESVCVSVEIESISLSLYNNSENPFDLDINGIFEFDVILSDYYSYFTSGTDYNITINVDPEDIIEESNESNNLASVNYYYEEQVPEWLFSPNTYSLNCSIDTFGYAVKFNESDIILENTLNAINGKINGYDLVNSTILENNTITTGVIYITIALYGYQNLTLRNIWNSHLNIVLCDNSQLSLYNSTIQEIYTIGSNEINLSNSSVIILSSGQITTNLTALKIVNNTSIQYCMLYNPITLEIENSSIQNLYMIVGVNIYAFHHEFLVFGNIRDSTIDYLLSYGQTNLNVYDSEIYQVNLMGKTQINLVNCIVSEAYVQQNALLILNNTKILSELSYGIVISSGSVNIIDGIIQGTDYINNTIFINANVTNRILTNIMVNNTGNVYISNFSCNFFLYDNANLVINDSKVNIPNKYGGYLQDSSSVTGINASFDLFLCQDNSSLDISQNSYIQTLIVNCTNDISIRNCTVEQITWYSQSEVVRIAEFIDTTIESFYLPQPSEVDLINSSIDMLYEGIKFQSGINYLNSSGIFGEAYLLSNINLDNSVIFNRTYKFVEIVGNAEVIIGDIHSYLSITAESGSFILDNCTLDSLMLMNDAIGFLHNCSTPDDGGFGILLTNFLSPLSFVCTDNSVLHINQTRIHESNFLQLMDNCQATIDDSQIFGIYLYQHSTANIMNSETCIIRVASSYQLDFALGLSNSSVELLSTISWNF